MLSRLHSIDGKYLYWAGAISGIAILSLVLLFSGSSQEKAPELGHRPIVNFKVVQLQKHIITKRFIGRTISKNMVDLQAMVSGRVNQVLIRENQLVKEGDPLILLSDEGKKEAVSEAEAMVSASELEFKAYKSLRDQGYKSEAAFYSTLSKLRGAEKALLIARENLKNSSINAPFSGIVHNVAVESGDVVSAYGNVLASIYDPNKMGVEVFISEMDTSSLLKYRLMDEPVKVVSGHGGIFDGKIENVSSKAEPITKSHKVKVVLDKSDDLLLGSTVEAYITVSEQNAYYVDSAALSIVDGKQIGIKILSDLNTVSFIPVSVLDDDSKGFWVAPKIAKDLVNSLRIITYGQAYVSEGSRVEASPAAA